MLRHQQVFQKRQTGEQANVLEGAGNLGFAVDLKIGQALQQEGFTAAALSASSCLGWACRSR